MIKFILIIFTSLLLSSSLVIHANTPGEQSLAKKDNAEVNVALMININKANEEQLLSLKGVGKGKAQAIISYRREKGNFTSIEELLQVKGIGLQVLEANSKRLSI